MTIPNERRTHGEECVVCGNDIIRLCVKREGATLEVLIQVHTEDYSWVTWANTPVDKCLYFQREDGSREAVKFHEFSLEEEGGDTRGLTLHGRLGSVSVNFTSLLHPMSIWTEHFIEIDGDMLAGAPLHHCWELPGIGNSPEICWPPQAGDTKEQPAPLAAFVQDGTSFAAFVPLYEHSRSGTNITHNMTDGLVIDHHVTPYCAALQSNWAFSYLLCMDPHALPYRGFQQVVRMLGKCGVPVGSTADIASAEPALPQVPEDAAAWIPFKNEGSLPEIVSFTKELLSQANDDFRKYDAALCWLDRLALQRDG